MAIPTNLSDRQSISTKNCDNQDVTTPRCNSFPPGCCEGVTLLVDKEGNISSVQDALRGRVIERVQLTDEDKKISKKFIDSRK